MGGGRRCPPAGALSQPLFQGTLIELESELREAGCGIEVLGEGGETITTSCIAYVDDIALLAPDMESLRRAFKIADRWAVRMRISTHCWPGEERGTGIREGG